MRMRVILPILLVAALMPAWGQTGGYSPPPHLPIVDVTFFPQSDSAVDQVLEFGVGDLFDPSALRSSIRNIFQLGVYSDVRVTWSRRQGGIALQFYLEKTPEIEGVSIVGNGPVSRSRIIKATRLDEDSRFDINREKRMVESLAELYRQEGFYNASIQVVNTMNLENNNVRMELRIEPGEATTLRQLNLSGFPVYSAEEILDLFDSIGVGRVFRESAFRREISLVDEFYTNEGYLAADVRINRITFDASTNSINASMTINAGPVIRLSVSPESGSNRQLLNRIPFDDDNIPVEIILESGREEMLASLKENGHADAEVSMDWEFNENYELEVDVTLGRGEVYRVSGMELRGLPEELRGQLAPRLFLTSKGLFSKSPYSEKLLNEDLRRIEEYLKEKGYDRGKVSLASPPDLSQGNELKLVVNVDAGRRSFIESMEFEGNDAISDTGLHTLAGVALGEPFSREIGVQLVQRLDSAYDMRGYADSTVSLTVSGEDAAKSLTFEIFEGERATVKKIIIAGNEISGRNVIEDALTFNEGDPFSQQQIVESQSNLYQTGKFNRVVIESLNPQTSGSERRVKVNVLERDPYAVLFGFGYDTEELIRFSVGVFNENIGGQNVRAGFSARVSDLQQRYQLSLGQPRGGLFFRNSSIRVFYEEIQREGYGARKKGIAFETSGYQFGGWKLLGRYQYRWIDIFNKDARLEIDRFEQPVRIHSFSAIVSRDTRDDPFNPGSGTLTTMIAQIAPDLPGSDARFASAEAQHARYFAAFSGVTAAANVRLGITRNFGNSEIPISERFFLGGSNSVRAFGLDELGPRYTGADGRLYPEGGSAFFNSNLELRFPLFIDISGVTFYDNGQVFKEIGDFDFSELEHVLGLGLRMATPLGPLRLDYGSSLKSNNTQFFITFGHAF